MASKAGGQGQDSSVPTSEGSTEEEKEMREESKVTKRVQLM